MMDNSMQTYRWARTKKYPRYPELYVMAVSNGTWTMRWTEVLHPFSKAPVIRMRFTEVPSIPAARSSKMSSTTATW